MTGRKPDVPARGEPVPPEQVQAWQDNTGAAFRQRWQAERNARAAGQRNRRGKRPAKPITGVRINPGGRT